MFEMGAETMKLPLEEKMKHEQGDEGMSFGSVHCCRHVYFFGTEHSSRYKAAGANAVDETGALDTAEDSDDDTSKATPHTEARAAVSA